MVFPAETEERVRRRALSISQEHLRKVVEMMRKATQLVEAFVNENRKAVELISNEIVKLEEEVVSARRMVSQELAEIGAILLSREDFLRFTYMSNEIADFCEGLAFRLIEILNMKWTIPAGIKADLIKLTAAVFETVSRLRETVITLNFDSSKALEKTREVEAAERAVDEIYRILEIKIIKSKMSIPAILLLREVAQLLEDAADKAEDAADIAMILALSL